MEKKDETAAGSLKKLYLFLELAYILMCLCHLLPEGKKKKSVVVQLICSKQMLVGSDRFHSSCGI